MVTFPNNIKFKVDKNFIVQVSASVANDNTTYMGYVARKAAGDGVDIYVRGSLTNAVINLYITASGFLA